MMKYRFIAAVLTAGLFCACSFNAPEPVQSYVPSPEYSVFHEGMIENITPEGWLKEILVRQKDGLTGHPEAMAYPYNSCLWAGNLSRDSESRGSDWWRY